ncbi:hypothetical protein COV81_02415, partial [Candidatus Peregrinibacteria bacterium CG11_big_fil_rev_8_21_14_0_20_41_10]
QRAGGKIEINLRIYRQRKTCNRPFHSGFRELSPVVLLFLLKRGGDDVCAREGGVATKAARLMRRNPQRPLYK